MQEIHEKSKRHGGTCTFNGYSFAICLHVFIELVEKLDVDGYATAMKMGLAHASSDYGWCMEHGKRATTSRSIGTN